MTERETTIKKLETTLFDTLIIGSGINGAVAGAALSGKGAKVALIDKNDFAGFTSQESSNLAWGGLKYLEYGEIRLVAKLCKSRNLLMSAFPTAVKEIRFLTTIDKGFRWHPWLLYLGSLLYWVLGRFFTRAPEYLNTAAIGNREPSVNLDNARGGFEYSDAILRENDARFVFGFVRRALRAGCAAANYVESLGGERDSDGYWNIRCRDRTNQRTFTVRTKILVNACGPFADKHNKLTAVNSAHRHVLSKGIHLIVDRLSASKRVLTFFADDGRPFFVLPMGTRTVIGTTDTPVEKPETSVTDADRNFVLENINKRLVLDPPLTRDDIIAERCGVRPLVVPSQGSTEATDWVKLSRKHVIDVDVSSNALSIYGGKLTDCINVGNEVCDAIIAMGVPLTTPKVRWFGEPTKVTHDDFLKRAKMLKLDTYTAPDAVEPLSNRLWRRYGLDSFAMLDDIEQDPRNAEILIESSEFIRCELKAVSRHEMVVNLSDFLRRRSKLAQIVNHDDLAQAAGLKEACSILFGAAAKEKWEAYFQLSWTTGLKLDTNQ